MAQIKAVVKTMGGSAVRVTWPNMKQGDVGEPTTYARYMDRSIQVRGSLGVGGGVAIKGSNDEPELNGAEFVHLTDLRGNDLVIRTPKIEQIEDCTYAVKPEIEGGDANTDVTVILYARKEE